MTNEEAIKHITTWLYAAPDAPPMQVVQALELAVDALRAGGKDMNVPTMSAGKPLTLEQLRGMVGKPAFLPEVNCNVMIARNEGVPLFTFSDGSQASAVDWYEEVGAAYAYQPAHIDREAWEPCGLCGTLNDEIMCKFSKKQNTIKAQRADMLGRDFALIAAAH